SAEQITTVGGFLRQHDPARRAMRNRTDVPTTLNPFRPVGEVMTEGTAASDDRVLSVERALSAGPPEKPAARAEDGGQSGQGSSRERVAAALARLRVVDAHLSSTIRFLDRRALARAD